MWSTADIVEAVAAGLLREADRLDAEQAVRGLDSCYELRLQRLLARSLRDAGYGVYREQRYPSGRRSRRASAGERCDLVLTPDRRPLHVPEAPPTLFDPPDSVPFINAFWTEVKRVAQFTTSGPNRRYSAQLLGDVRGDVEKLAKEPGIRHAGLLIVLFTHDEQVAEHDLEAWRVRCAERGLPIGRRCVRCFPIRDRLGNEQCSVALFRVLRA